MKEILQNTKVDFVLRKFAYIYLKFTEFVVNAIVFCYSLIFKRKSNRGIKKIAAFWHSPVDVMGSNVRMGEWTRYFEKDGYVYDNYHINTMKEFRDNYENAPWTKKYIFFSTCLWRRLPQVLKAHNYDVLWIGRSIIPIYPRKKAFIEKRLKKVVPRIIVDTHDGGDYSANPNLMEEILSCADEVTIAYKFQIEMYSDRFKVNQIFWTIPVEKYIVKNNYNVNDKIVIGWMGAPGNFDYVLQLLPILKKVNQNYPFVFRYICRKNFNGQLEGLNCDYHPYGDDYYQIISTFDIGISPYLVSNVRTRGKIAMKHQEFLLCGIPQVCSPVAISEFVEDGRDVKISNSLDDWYSNICMLINSKDVRENLGKSSQKIFNEHYRYETQYEKLKKVLVG